MPRVLILAVGLVAVVSPVGAQTPVPLGAPFMVNSYTTSSQVRPAITMDGSGRFVVVWESYEADNGDASESSIQGQLFAADGSAVGSQFLVNTYTLNRQSYPAIAASRAGDFVVVWDSLGGDNGDDRGTSVQAQRFSVDGSAVGSQFLVNSYTRRFQETPAIAMGETGDFVVVWISYGSDNGDTSDTSIQAQRFAADGSAVGSQFRVNSYTTGFQIRPAVAVDESSGDFVVVWSSYGSYGDDDAFYSIQGQRFAADGSAAGSQFQVNSSTPDSQLKPAITMGGSEGFVVVWYSASFITGQVFDPEGVALGAQLQTFIGPSNQGRPGVAMDTSGDFVVVGPRFPPSVQAQRFDAAGGPVGSQFRVDSGASNDQGRPVISMARSGDFVVVWHGGGDIEGRRFRMHLPMFADDFESGDLLAWSVSVP